MVCKSPENGPSDTVSERISIEIPKNPAKTPKLTSMQVEIRGDSKNEQK